mgnify:CR=1 FL=1
MTTTNPTADSDAGDDPDEPGSSTGEANIRNETQDGSGEQSSALSMWCRGHNLPQDDIRWLRKALGRALEVVGCAIRRIDVVIVDDDEMQRMNRAFHGVDDTTDVLSFQQSATGDSIETDIAICADQAAREAKQRNHEPRRELLLYALHGLLHCFGFDDSTDAEREAMHAEEDRILQAIGVGVVYGTNSGSEVPADRDSRSPSGGEQHR